MNELFLHIAINDINREMDHSINGPNPYESYDEMDKDQHLSRMRRLINWTGTTLGAGRTPARGRAESQQAIARTSV